MNYMLKWYFEYVGLNTFYYYNGDDPILFKNVATGNFKMTYIAHILFTWHSTALDSLSYTDKFNKFNFLINASNTSKKKTPSQGFQRML